MIAHKNSKCSFFRTGIVLDSECEKIVSHCFCEIDEMEDDKSCSPGECQYYERMKERKVKKEVSK